MYEWMNGGGGDCGGGGGSSSSSSFSETYWHNLVAGKNWTSLLYLRCSIWLWQMGSSNLVVI